MVDNVLSTWNHLILVNLFLGRMQRVRILALTREFLKSSSFHIDCSHELLFTPYWGLEIYSFPRRSDTCAYPIRAKVLFAFHWQIVNCFTIYLAQTFIAGHNRCERFFFSSRIASLFKIRSPVLLRRLLVHAFQLWIYCRHVLLFDFQTSYLRFLLKEFFKPDLLILIHHMRAL